MIFAKLLKKHSKKKDNNDKVNHSRRNFLKLVFTAFLGYILAKFSTVAEAQELYIRARAVYGPDLVKLWMEYLYADPLPREMKILEVTIPAGTAPSNGTYPIFESEMFTVPSGKVWLVKYFVISGAPEVECTIWVETVTGKQTDLHYEDKWLKFSYVNESRYVPHTDWKDTPLVVRKIKLKVRVVDEVPEDRKITLRVTGAEARAII